MLAKKYIILFLLLFFINGIPQFKKINSVSGPLWSSPPHKLDQKFTNKDLYFYVKNDSLWFGNNSDTQQKIQSEWIRINTGWIVSNPITIDFHRQSNN